MTENQSLYKDELLGDITAREFQTLVEQNDPRVAPIRYRKIIADLRRQIVKMKAKVDDRKTINKKTVGRIQTDRFKKYLKKSAINQRKISERATDVYYLKIKRDLLEKSNYVDGVIAFPVIQKFTKDNDLAEREFAILVVLCCHEWINVKDLVLFLPYSLSLLRTSLNRVVARGLAAKYKGGAGFGFVYSATLQGQKLFELFQKEFKAKISTMFEGFDKTFKNHNVKPRLVIDDSKKAKTKIRIPKIDENHKVVYKERKKRG